MTTLEECAGQLAWFEAFAERQAAAGRHDLAVSAVHSGAGIAVMNHPAAFASDRLDAVLLRAGATLGGASSRTDHGGDPRHVLHVLTHATPQGGHARLAARWMQRDTDRRHSVVITTPIVPTPPALRAAVDASGGVEHPPVEVTGTPMQRARVLRELCLAHDAVVLYQDPHDPLPALALSGLRRRPPVLAADINDHCFTLGRPAVDLHVCNREAAARTARDERGLPAERVAVLPLPVELPGPPPDVEAVRRATGMAPGDLLIATVGADYKYVTDGVHLLDLVEPVLMRHDNVRLVAVGPAHEGRWADAHARTGGRVTALGVVEALPVLAAADVVVESYPTGGSTASAEAAALGRPLLGFAPDEAEAALCAAGAVIERPATVAGFRARLGMLLDDPGLRNGTGRRTYEANALYHDAGAWRAELARCYARAAELGPVRPSELRAPRRGRRPVSEMAHALHARADKLHSADDVELVRARLELLGRDPALGACIEHAPGGYPRVSNRFERAITAPSAHPESVADAVAVLRLVHTALLADTCAITVAPDEVAAVVPLVERALAAGPDFPLDLVPADRPDLLITGPSQVLIGVVRDVLGDPARWSAVGQPA